MRVLVAWILAFGLVAAPAMAKAGRTSDETVAKANSDNDAAAKGKTDETAAASKTDSTTSATTPAKAESPALEAEFQQLRDLLETQAAQLKAQSEQLKQQQQKMEALEKQLNAASSAAAGPAGAVAGSESSSSAPSAPSGPSSGIITASVGNSGIHTTSPAAPAQDMSKGDEPAALHFKGITITPGGFMAAETVWRSKALSADVNTPFNSAPMPGASNSNLSEFNASGRQSRVSMLAEGKLSDVKIGGYYEADFLGAGSASNSNQSNSYVFRQRQFWAQAAFDNGFKVTGGQMWSLVTETTKGMDNRTEALPNTIDAQYNVGFSWARQYGLRFTKDFGDKFWLGFAVEGAQTTFTVHGNPTQSITTGATTVSCPDPGVGTCSAAGTVAVGGTTTVYTNFLLGATGASGGLYNPLANYSYNPGPDLVFKAALEPGFGHYEVFGVVSEFRDRIFPCEVGTITPTTPCTFDPTVTAPGANDAYNDSRTGGGAGANARWALFQKHVDLGFHFFGGSGIGRYGSGGLPDGTIRPDGTLALLRNYQSLGTLQFHITPKLDLNLNAGGEYSARAAYIKSGATPNEGYGAQAFSNAGCYTEVSPTTTVPAGTTGSQGYIAGGLANCTADTRNLIEGTAGFWYRFYKGPKGTIQFGSQYSYYVRNTWSGVAPASGPGTGDTTPHGVENMWFTSFRYYLP
jgi:hypothetical protein